MYGTPKIFLEYNWGAYECDPYWNWTVDNGCGLTASGSNSSARRAVKNAKKALDHLARIQSQIPQAVHIEQTEDTK